jgi:predicted metallopeptidase
MQTELFHSEEYNADKLSIDELFKRSRKYQGSEAFTRFFNFIARFKHYSRFNTMLVFLQNEHITFFGGSQFWKKKFNRSIGSEARPYVILQPFGPVMLAYDVMETEGKESPEEFIKNGLGSDPFEVKGRISSKTLDDAILIAKSYGIRIIHKPLSFFNAGYVTTIFKPGPPEIALKSGLTFEQNLAVLIHELAHLFLGHTGHAVLRHTNKEGKIKEVKLIQRNLTLTARELEAETISFLICKKLGLETKSAEYLASYIKIEKDLEEFSFELVIKTTDKIEEMFLKKWTLDKQRIL